MTRRSTHHIMVNNFRIMKVIDVIQNMQMEEKKKTVYDFFVGDKSYGLTFTKLEEKATELTKEPAWVNAKTIHELVDTELFKSIRFGYVLCMMRDSGVIVGYQFYRTKLSVATKILLCNRKTFGIKDSKITEKFNLIRDSIMSAIDQDMRTRNEIITYALRNLKQAEEQQPLPFSEEKEKPQSAVEELTEIYIEGISREVGSLKLAFDEIVDFLKAKEYKNALEEAETFSIEYVKQVLDRTTKAINRIIEINKGN